MIVAVPEKHKRPGVCYAVTDDGVELPVIDVTHPAFAVESGQAELARLAEASLRAAQFWSMLPPFIRRLLEGRSTVIGRSRQAEGSVLDGVTTYLIKLGPDNLGAGYAGAMDRRYVRAANPSVANRLQSVSRLLADGLAPLLAARKAAPVHLLDIAGSVATDSLNALILIQKEHPDWLAGRRIQIHVLDLDRAGPSFGARALGALLSEGAPLHGLEATLDHVKYDWSAVSGLREALRVIDLGDTVVAASSEGGLFEYGSDVDIVANLEALRDGTPEGTFVVGSLYRDESLPQKLKQVNRTSMRPFGLEQFRDLVGRAGWRVERTIEGNPLYHMVSLAKVRT